MFNWFRATPSVVESLTDFKAKVDAEFVKAMETAHDRYNSTIRYIEDEAHAELKHIEAVAQHTAQRIEKLLHSDLLHEAHQMAADALHTVLKNIKVP